MHDCMDCNGDGKVSCETCAKETPQ
jgi:hypothetical protein